MVLQNALAAFVVAAIVAPFGYYAGLLARYFRAPAITGYVLSGIVCGPYGLRILSHLALSELNVVEGACLAIIGLAAGAELNLADLARARHSVVAITVAICGFTWLFVYTALLWVAAYAPLLPGLAPAHVVAVRNGGWRLRRPRPRARACSSLTHFSSVHSMSTWCAKTRTLRSGGPAASVSFR